MKLIAGLGNPGRKYAGTRHNVGFEIVDALAARHGLEWESAPAEAMMAKWRSANALVVKPLTFMNLSGHAVGELLRYFKIEFSDLLVIVDEAQLELGRLRTRPGGSAGGHNGLKSLIEQLGTQEFPRMRVGVGRGDARRDLADHVLATFDRDERTIVGEAVARAVDAVEVFIADGIGPMMNRFNRKNDVAEEDAKE
ncbi:MAG TPA: aminoacyl-tRNA hydrolase [Vicinamibacterales bacterium]